MGLERLGGKNRDDLPLFVRANSPPQQPFSTEDQDDSLVQTSLPAPAIGIPPSTALPTNSTTNSEHVSTAVPLEGLSTFAKIRSLQSRIGKSKTRNDGSLPLINDTKVRSGHATYVEGLLSRTENPPSHPRTAQNDDGDDSLGDGEDAEYKRKKRHFENLKRKNGGSLTFVQDLEWTKVQKDETIRRNRLAMQLLRDQDENGGHTASSLPGDDDEIGPNSDAEDFNYGDDGTLRQRQTPSLSQRDHKLQSLQDAEILSMRVALEASGDLPKKKRKNEEGQPDKNGRTAGKTKGKSRVQKSTSRNSKAATNQKKGPKGPRMTVKQKRAHQDALRQVSSLFSGDVFRDQAAQDAADQPTFTSRNKNHALKELIASVPIDNQKEAKGDMNTLLAATKDFDGHGSVKSDGTGLWLVKGMKTSLKPYQILGTAFMRRREHEPQDPRGGLMADQMGLGKTLMMLANIVNGRPPSGHRKTTLIVASPSLLTQWANEIATHSNCNLKVMRYGSGNRLESNDSLSILGGVDIVLTTYTEVMNSYPKHDPPVSCQTVEQKELWWRKTFERYRGILHKMQFYRVVLDEAQAIKNHATRTSIACRAIMADMRWCITGTPIQNNLKELYPYFKFLNVPHTGSFHIFKSNYCDPKDATHTQRLLVQLNQFMIRRTHKDIMFGAPILKLPKADHTTHWCEFNMVERNIYAIVSKRFAERINSMAVAGTLEKSYSNILVMLLRLRQLTAHVLMLQYVMKDLLEREDIEKIRDVVKNHAKDGSSAKTITALRAQLDHHAKLEIKRTAKLEQQRARALKKGVDPDMQPPKLVDHDVEEPHLHTADDDALSEDHEPLGSGSGGTFGKSYKFEPYLKTLTSGEGWENARKKSRCCVCYDKPVAPWITSCHHIYCQACYESATIQAAEQGHERIVACHKCKNPFQFAHACDADGEPEDPFIYAAPATRSKTKGKNASKNNTVRLERENIDKDWLTISPDGVLPSAKTIAIKAQILNWRKENPSVKIIIYTQFLAMIRILKKICEEEHWGCEQYHGEMTFQSRDKAIHSFAEEEDTNILLSSLRCGGLGLNLTMASRVIVVDPWWNNAAEQQAFCRIYRIGQQDTTFMTRFCVRNTVDERILAMQERKQKEIDTVMEDGGRTVKKLDLAALMRLFGTVTEDSNGRPFILVDNPHSRGGFRADNDHEGYADDL
ncbi:hypothetical protein BU24DRAFT_357138 [Aaosphaeria arxii CBS 175.79]|uniref:Uncharacterized protein n=1 Tax=Aaosphaeria arxii CBS 175.79 TaxID=1450172 RepID=A0A6A5XAX5_9PLEO|nr:uncharacterized protein BU24DRAFT_357138 [Aaosphaeria arxii CBS 175.79]KAF2009924.1 hypothetical protein BU24DRAFT_357138 [Aaosphaeria arxii CBS 175.79]